MRDVAFSACLNAKTITNVMRWTTNSWAIRMTEANRKGYDRGAERGRRTSHISTNGCGIHQAQDSQCLCRRAKRMLNAIYHSMKWGTLTSDSAFARLKYACLSGFRGFSEDISAALGGSRAIYWRYGERDRVRHEVWPAEDKLCAEHHFYADAS